MASHKHAQEALLSASQHENTGYDSTGEPAPTTSGHQAVTVDSIGSFVPDPVPDENTGVIQICAWQINQRVFQNVNHPPQPMRYLENIGGVVTEISDVVRGDLFIDEAFGMQLNLIKKELEKVTKCCDGWGEVKIWLGGFNIGGVQQRAKEIGTLKKNLLTAGHTPMERHVQGALSIAAAVGGGLQLHVLSIPCIVAAILLAIRIYYNRKQLRAFVAKLKQEFLALGDTNSVFGRRAQEQSNLSVEFGFLKGRWIYHVSTINTEGTMSNKIDPRLQENFRFTWTSANLETSLNVTPYQPMLFWNMVTTLALALIIAVPLIAKYASKSTNM